ncbi:MAG: ATP-dependent DNA helicase RecG [Betaproteobacteria bacterium]|nr:ATP-dependent DNA helicase RecG [Betaproteobacteria bacterium]
MAARAPSKKGAARPAAAPRNTLRDKLARLGLKGDAELLLHLPLRYEDRTRLTPLAELKAGDTTQVEAEVATSEVTYRPRRALICHLIDGFGKLTLRFFNFYPNHVAMLAPGRRVRAYGEVRQGYHGLEMVHPTIRDAACAEPLPLALTPVYPTTAGLPQETLRRLVRRALDAAAETLADTLPEVLRQRLGLWDFATSLRTLHAPPPEAALETLESRQHPAWQRLKFDELLAQQLSLKAHRRARQARRAQPLAAAGTLARTLLGKLPFRLTEAQRQAVLEIRRDLELARPMHRLLQGDVGSGKTIVAALAALHAVEAGFQVAFMAPTEILAEQHYRKLAEWLKDQPVPLIWLVGAQGASARRDALAAGGSGAPAVVVGTHALFQEGVSLPRLALLIIDEQHRFGVTQRLALRGRSGGELEPHQLMMSATPIPRTLAMSYYADLDVSVLDQMPPGRRPVVTKLASQRRRPELIARVREVCATGQQVYWVCPLIEESEKIDLQNAVATRDGLAEALPELRIGLLHGRMKPDEKAAVMQALTAKALDVLVATTVVEVGVDVPNATLMVIEHAERFGLAQLHQLRGRVGRGGEASACVLLYDEPLGQVAKARLKVIFEHHDGFEIARQDLLIRGPGEFLGARQSGLPLLRFADLETDLALMEAARQVADEVLQDFPLAAEQHVARWLGARQEFFKA